jgi:Flp pilus assembly protein TadG
MARTIKQWLIPIRRHFGSQRGSSMIIMALAITAIMGMMAIVIDGGYAYGEKRQMQNAADAGALAGLRTYWIEKFPNETARKQAAQQKACEYAALNGAQSCTATFLNATNSHPNSGPNCPSIYILKVTTSKTFNTFFAGAIGRNQLSVGGSSKAQVQGLASSSILWPVIPKKQTFQIPSCYASDPCGTPSCPKYEIWNSSKEAAGNAGWLNWNREGHVGASFPCPDQGEPGLVCELLDPSASGYWRVGEWVPGDPGLKNGSAVRDAVESWMCKHVTVPVWDQISGTGNNTMYRIAGFAEFVLTDTNLTGNPKWIKGQFVRWSDSGASNHDDCEDFNYLCNVHLVN